MISVPKLFNELDQAVQTRPYIVWFELLDVGEFILKARLYFDPDLFVQVYRNDRFQTTNFALIHGGRRIYGRDELEGIWHRHPDYDPDAHDTSPEGQRAVTLNEFLDEVEQVAITLNLL